jgi:hypothetical protein
MGRLNLTDGRDEPIAAPCHRGDITRRLDVVREHLAQLIHAALQARLTGETPLPHLIEQLVLGDHLPRVPDQITEKIEYLGRQYHFLGIPPQANPGRIQPKRGKSKLGALGHLTLPLCLQGSSCSASVDAATELGPLRAFRFSQPKTNRNPTVRRRLATPV